MAESVESRLDDVDREVLGATYIVEALLGEGTYGVVFRARNAVTGAMYAIKKLRIDGHSEGVPATTLREVTLLHDLRHHPNVVRLLEVLCGQHRVYLVFELLDEDLRSFIRRYRRSRSGKQTVSVVPLHIVKDFTRQMLHALWSCHNNRIIHRDLKPGNTLISARKQKDGETEESYILKLADFGLARTFEMPLLTYTREVMTLWYRAPEILLGEKHYTPAVDVWSLGCIVAEMIVGHSLFQGSTNVEQLDKIFYVVGTPTEETWQGLTSLPGYDSSFKVYRVAPLPTRLPDFDTAAIEFVAFLLQTNPKSRPTVTEVLKHPFLQDD
ncbi:putative cdc2-related kinase [Trypanosoma theileri]|uniref:Putative cdc2-related kinase n=1 Tax=Trypanosoma theileri TaxID=67003 RepID=A0A1X0P3X8_9TRYP|nr:putative cdc2-related kinase [Trypanosoma theileri]ORC91637.1 putative cdc2-related kinase [Trypanosoma theileri]